MMRMMAGRYAYLQSGRRLGSFGNRFLNFVSRDSLLPPSFLPTTWRAVHVSVYDKNPEDHTTPTVVPDTVIQPQSSEYWAPHPQTGVFGPSAEQNPLASGEGSSSSSTTAPEDSVLEQKAFFRPLEDLEKPPPQP